jgi:hypothetical protein
MDFIKQYIIQSITAASNNLRLNTQKIEVVALLRELISKSPDLEKDIREMKKVTELSKFAIRLHEIYNFLNSGQIDILKISEKFKEHSQYLIKDLSNMTDLVNPVSFKKISGKIEGSHHPEEHSEPAAGEPANGEVFVDLSKRHTEEFISDEQKNELMKEDLIMEDEKDSNELFFQNYETNIIETIKPVDTILKKILSDEYEKEELIKYAEIMKKNGELSSQIGFEIIANMHRIISKSFYLIAAEDLSPIKEVIDAIRSCLIVIVAVVKGKEVDITNYLNRAEEFGRQIQTLKTKAD